MGSKMKPEKTSRGRMLIILVSIPCALVLLRTHSGLLSAPQLTQRTATSIQQCTDTWQKPKTPGAANEYGMPPGYKTNPVRYFNDLKAMQIVWQPDVYNYAAHLSALSGSWIIDVGSGTGLKAARIFDESPTKQRFIELDFGPNLELARQSFQAAIRPNTSEAGVRDVDFFEWDISGSTFPEIGVEKLRGATIVSSDVIEHLENPDQLVDGLLALMHGCGAANLIISTINRSTHHSPKNNVHHIREWTTPELESYLNSRGAAVQECILTYSSNKDKNCCPEKMQTSVCLISTRHNSFPPLADIHDYFPYKAPVTA
jgi:hypothetical protein